MYKTFYRMGTKQSAYLKRVINYKTIFFYNVVVDSNNIIIYNNNDKQIDAFNSKSTFKQFIDTNIWLGIIVECRGNFKIVNKGLDIEKITNAIFTKSDDKKANIYKDTRKMCLLYLLNWLNDSNLNGHRISKVRGGQINRNDIKNECSTWELKVSKSLELLPNILQRIWNEIR